MNHYMSSSDREFVDILRGASILRVVLAHLGLLWFYPPYSQYIGVFLCLLFFISGAVSYGSFLRSSSPSFYLIRRLLLIVIPFYVFSCIVLVTQVAFFPDMGVGNLVRWLLVWPALDLIYFPMGQIWFLNALLAMVLLSFPIYLAMRFISWVWIIPLFLCFLVLVVDYFYDLRVFFLGSNFLNNLSWGNQAWTVVSLFSFFVLGSVYYRFLPRLKGKIAFFFSIILFFSYFCLVGLKGSGFYFSDYAIRRDLIYVVASLGAILMILSLKGVVVLVCRVRFLRYFFMFFNRYAYMIFLTHTLVLFWVERVLGWQDLSGDIYRAIARMVIVVIFTMLVSKPLGDFSRVASHWVVSKLDKIWFTSIIKNNRNA